MKTKLIQEELFKLQDLKYKDFLSKLIPNVDIEKIIGIKTPILRSLAKKYYKDIDIEEFLNDLPHEYYEENNLHAFIISEIKDYDLAIKRINEFLPFIDNWATCDSFSPKCFNKNKILLLKDIDVWLKSKKTYTVRFAIEMLQNLFLDEDFNPLYLKKVASVKSQEYYVNMMIAWYFATALSKQWKDAIIYLENKSLNPFVHNKTIQKARESFRIKDADKEYLKTLKLI